MKTVVIFHGFPEALSKSKSLVFAYFLKNKYRIIMPDLMSKDTVFGQDEIIKSVLVSLKGRKPEVIVGISMGGFLAPFLAKEFPKSKLVLIGTGPKLKTDIPVYNWLVRLESKDERLLLVKLLKLTPRGLYRWVYYFFNKNDLDDKINYRKRADENYDEVFGLPDKELREFLKFAGKVDNTKLLRKLSNKTIIFGGNFDKIMPAELSIKMSKLMKNSKLVISNRLHYDVFIREDYDYLDKFLN